LKGGQAKMPTASLAFFGRKIGYFWICTSSLHRHYFAKVRKMPTNSLADMSAHPSTVWQFSEISIPYSFIFVVI
jgi:hypothetical protein